MSTSTLIATGPGRVEYHAIWDEGDLKWNVWRRSNVGTSFEANEFIGFAGSIPAAESLVRSKA